MNLGARSLSTFIFAAGLAIAADSAATSGSAAGGASRSFDKTVRPVMAQSCLPCHNERIASGELNLAGLMSPESIVQHRDDWERVVHKIRTGEMPPKGVPKPPADRITAVIEFLQSEFDRADRNVKPDPGRVTARRLNRSEYSNTIRDLLAVDFRAEKDFPSDDTGHGFDNIGDVLTVSPVLMEKYLNAAEQIAARAIGADPLPKKPLQAEYLSKQKNIRRIGMSMIEVVHRIEWDAEYTVRIGMPGNRGPEGQPVMLGFWMDGKLLEKTPIETKPSDLVYFSPFSEHEFRLYLPAGDHAFRAGFLDDHYADGMWEEEAFNEKANKYLNAFTFIGPFPTKVERASRKKILTCDPNSGAACIEKIVSTLARKAYRRPVSKEDVASLMKFVDFAKADGESVEQGIQLAIQAMLVSPHFLFRIERDPNPNDPVLVHRISDVELASRLSYFLWSSMPDDQLLDLAEQGKLHEPAVLDAQVKRMLEDQRASAFVENFAGQWLETRNLDFVKPDPQKFPTWGPALRDAMKTETRLFFEAMLRENRPLSDFLDANFTFVNETLATHYGMKGVEGPDFQRVELTTGQRGGLLSQAGVLTVSSYPTRTSPVIRGKYVLQNILGAAPPPPPPDVPLLDEEAVGSLGSLRQQLEKHRTSPSCASCHNRMDVLGFGLENYDAIGKWRTMDGKFPVDAAGTLPNGKSFKSPSEMRALLKENIEEFSRCLTEKMMTYALGRGLERYDRKTVNDTSQKLATSGYRFQELIYEIVRSLPFQMRRGEVSKAESSKAQIAADRRR